MASPPGQDMIPTEGGTNPVTQNAPPKGAAVLAVLSNAPPDAILKVLDIAHDLIRSNTALRQTQADFEKQLTLLRTSNDNINARLAFLRDLLLDEHMGDEDRGKLVDAICSVVVK